MIAYIITLFLFVIPTCGSSIESIEQVRHLEATIERIRKEWAELQFEQQEAAYNELTHAAPGTLYAIRIEGDQITHSAVADEIAQRAGYKIVRTLQSFKNTYIAERLIRKRKKRNVDDGIVGEILAQRNIRWAEQLEPIERVKRKSIVTQGMPINAYEVSPSMFIEDAWKLGFTGKNVSVAILDDGIDYLHLDLLPRFSRANSYDFVKNRPDPFPEHGPEFGHGTMCSGVVGMHRQLAKCGVGVAPGASIGGVKMLGKNNLLNDAIEADALAFHSENMDIMIASWGPKDDGQTAERPGPLTREAFQRGISMGRSGKGTLFVFASGNGGMANDTCAMDGYASNVHTLAFGSASPTGNADWWSEPCSALLATVASGGHKGIRTTSLDGSCSSFAGSSATAPIAAGILALALEANPHLTQRDIQHLIVQTSSREYLEGTWIKNGAGLYYSNYFGFGLLNARRLIETAKNWHQVGEERVCSKSNQQEVNGNFSDATPFSISISMDGCHGTSAEINYIERISLTLNVTHPRRGSIRVNLVSPAGTQSTLLAPRPLDNSPLGISGFPLVSTHFWGENPHGKWRLIVLIVSQESNDFHNMHGHISDWNLAIHGTYEDPLKSNPRDLL